MKKIILISIVLLVLAVQYAYTNNEDKQWTKINDYMYIDKSSITETANGVVAWFKFYNTPENKIYGEYDNIPVYYETIKYDIGCNSNTIFLEQIKQYDKNNNLLYSEINTHNVGASCEAYVNGEIICKTLCNK